MPVSQQAWDESLKQTKSNTNEPEEDVSKSTYFLFSYFIHFHHLFLYRFQRHKRKIIFGLIAASVICVLIAAFTIPLFAFGLYTGEDKAKKNKIISVLFSTNINNDYH